MEKKNNSTKWIIIGVVLGVLLLVGAIRAAVPKPAADAPADEAAETVAPSDPDPVSDPEPAADPEPTADEKAQAALSEALGGASLLFSGSVRNDSTGKWRMLRVSSAVPIHEHLGEYAAAFVCADDEVHIVINFALSTTTVITSGSGVLYVSVYQYADGEEHDAKLIPGGEKLAEYIYTTATGALEAVE